MEPKTRRKLLLVGVLLVLVSPPLFWATCEDRGDGRAGASGGYELEGFTGVTITYTPDGGATGCTAGLGPVYLPLGVAAILITFLR